MNNKFIKDAQYLSKHTTFWVYPYIKDFMDGLITEREFRIATHEIFKENHMDYTMETIIRDNMGYGKILNIESILVENIITAMLIHNSTQLSNFEDNIVFINNFLFKMYSELLYNLDNMIKEIKRSTY